MSLSSSDEEKITRSMKEGMTNPLIEMAEKFKAEGLVKDEKREKQLNELITKMAVLEAKIDVLLIQTPKGIGLRMKQYPNTDEDNSPSAIVSSYITGRED